MDKFDFLIAGGVYELWLSDNHTGSKEDFRAWLSGGEAGNMGERGKPGKPGIKGVDGKSSFEIFKTAYPEVVTNEEDYVDKLGSIFSKKDANLSIDYSSEDVTGNVTTVVVPPNNTENLNVNPEDLNNLPTGVIHYIEVWDDLPVNTVVKNISDSAKGVAPFTFFDIGAQSNLPDYNTSIFEIMPNGDIKVKSASALQNFYRENVASQVVNSVILYYAIKDKYGRISVGNKVTNSFSAYGLVFQIKSASKIMFNAFSYRFDILENVENGDWVGTVSGYSKSSSPITYSIESDLDILSIDSSTGKITIKNKGLIASSLYKNISFIVTATNGSATKTVDCSFTLYKPVDEYIINFSISEDGRAILKTQNSPVPFKPGINTYLEYNGTYIEKNRNFATTYTITKSNASKQNLGTYQGQYYGGFPASKSITELFPGDVPKNNGYEIGPYDKITEFRVFVGYQYNDIVRATWREKPTRINGLEGSDQNTIPTKELVLTKPL